MQKTKDALNTLIDAAQREMDTMRAMEDTKGLQAIYEAILRTQALMALLDSSSLGECSECLKLDLAIEMNGTKFSEFICHECEHKLQEAFKEDGRFLNREYQQSK